MRKGRTSAAGLWRFSSEYSWAGNAVVEANKGRFSHPAYFLYCRAIELALKAFLVARGISYTKLRNRPYGHDLEALLRLADRNEFSQFATLSRAEAKTIAMLNSEYASKQMEYIVTGSFTIPGINGVQMFTHLLVDSLRDFCVEASTSEVGA